MEFGNGRRRNLAGGYFDANGHSHANGARHVNGQLVHGTGASEPLRIAMIMPPWYEVPPAGYGGLEKVCASLIDGLVDRGHQVTMFGTGIRTGTKATFVSTHPQLQYPRLLESLPELVHLTRVNELVAQSNFDIVHDHTTVGPVTASARSAPTVVTVHGSPIGELNAYLSHVDDSVALVAISNAQRRGAPNLAWAATVYNAIDLDDSVKAEPSAGPVLWLGRFDPEKGPDLAIVACREAGLPLVLAGKANQKSEWAYLDEVIRPMLHDQVELVLNAERPRTEALLATARALILPIRWEEPFGMVMIEAMAKGTPVVALGKGAVPEVVRHGRTGFICADTDELPDALRLAHTIDPIECAEHVRSSFSVELMAQRYEAVYRDTLRLRANRDALVNALAAPALEQPTR
jgi:glycosyltransferase involved in cell wall biosynthesis